MKFLYMSRLVVLLENILPFSMSGNLKNFNPSRIIYILKLRRMKHIEFLFGFLHTSRPDKGSELELSKTQLRTRQPDSLVISLEESFDGVNHTIAGMELGTTSVKTETAACG